MKRKFFSNISLLLVLNIVVKAFWVLGIDRSVQNRVGATEYGLYFSLFGFSVLFTILLDFGITNYNNRSVSVEPGRLRGMIGNIFIIRLVFAVLYALVSLVTARIIGYSGRQLNLLYMLLANQFIASFILYLRSNISALQLFRIDSFLSVTDRFIMILVCSFFLWGYPPEQFRIEWFIYGQSAGYLVTLIVALVLVLVHGDISGFSFSFKEVRTILKGAFPFALTALFMSVYWRIDTVMLERMLGNGATESGIYAQSFRLLDAAAMIPYLFAVILLPMFSRMSVEKKKLADLTRFSMVLVLIPTIAVSAICIAYPGEIMETLYTSHVDESSTLLSILMGGYIPVALVYVFSTLLTATGRLKTINYIAATGMVLNITLNFILIPNWQARGSATATLITQLLMALLFMIFALRNVSADFNRNYIFKIISYIAVVILIVYFSCILDIPVLISILVTLFVSAVIPFVFRLISLSEIVSLSATNGN